MGVVMGLTSRSTLGKIAACWLPIFTFFALGYEHSVVNMFVIPAGMWMGAPVSIGEWWLWNQLPVTAGQSGRRSALCRPADAVDRQGSAEAKRAVPIPIPLGTASGCHRGLIPGPH